jgi:membrane associated rhomboid family serine protease
VPVVTAGIIVVNVVVFVLELMRGDAFVTQWAAVPSQIVSGHHWITILTAMFMHGSWSHIIGNMIFLWAFAPEIEDGGLAHLLGAAQFCRLVLAPRTGCPSLRDFRGWAFVLPASRDFLNSHFALRQ